MSHFTRNHDLSRLLRRFPRPLRIPCPFILQSDHSLCPVLLVFPRFLWLRRHSSMANRRSLPLLNSPLLLSDNRLFPQRVSRRFNHASNHPPHIGLPVGSFVENSIAKTQPPLPPPFFEQTYTAFLVRPMGVHTCPFFFQKVNTGRNI